MEEQRPSTVSADPSSTAPAGWPPTNDPGHGLQPPLQQQPQQDVELLVDQHHQLAVSDLLDDVGEPPQQQLPPPPSMVSGTIASNSADALPEDVTLGTEMLADPLLAAQPEPVSQAVSEPPAPPFKDEMASAGFDEVAATPAPPGVGPGQDPLIPYFQSQPPDDLAHDPFANLPPIAPAPTLVCPIAPSPNSQISPDAAATPKPISPSAGSIISFENASMSGQRASAVDKNLPGIPHTVQPPVRMDRRASSIFAQNAPLGPSAPLDPKFAHLPTCRWIDAAVFYDIPPRDPVGEIFSKAFPPTSNQPRPARRIVRVEDVLNQPDPLLALVAAHSWRSVASYARSRLIDTHPTDVPAIMRLWFVRILALTKLKLHEFASGELQKVAPDLDSMALHYETYPETFPGRSGSMVSFEIRMYWARIPAFKGRPMETINRLYALLRAVRAAAAGTESGDVARAATRAVQVQLSIANIFLVDLRDHRAATAILVALCAQYPADAQLAAALGRLYLQVGNIPAARAAFARHPGSAPTTRLANQAFLDLAEGAFPESLEPLTNLLAAQAGASPTHFNNVALAHLYTGNVTQAVSFLDSIVIEQPQRAASCEDLLFNLCSLYDLCDCSVERKRKLVAGVVAKWAGDSFNPACLKLQ
ncbi:Trafficking protein particle complex subunit 12 [Geranomyces variabilis]|uniref:Trafficking protein particle complex subunit 12 n=1 Tax=Geranomyces variabilis TaxID=109894 RepID=A0AAD5XR29_9FUNG|nr:Trafficking protein particle complex subunit 12 [Geranomyces variabilis]